MDPNVKDILSSGRRERLEIMAAAIALARKPVKHTQLKHRLNLGFETLSESLGFMIDKRLIEKQVITKAGKNTTYVYRATEKGLAFLKLYCDILALFYGEDFMKSKHNLAVICLQYCKETEST